MSENIKNEREGAKEVFDTSKKSFLLGLRFEPQLMSKVVVIGILITALGLLQLTSFSKVIDEIVLIQRQGGILTHNFFVQMGILTLSFILPAIMQNFMSRYIQSLRLRYITHASMLRIDIFSNLDVGTIESSEFQTKLERAQQWGVGSLVNLTVLVVDSFRNVAGFLISAIILYLINPWLVLLAIVGGLPLYFLQKKYTYQIYKLYHDRTDEMRISNDRNSFFMNAKKMVEVILFQFGQKFKKEVEEMNNKFDSKVLGVYKKRLVATMLSDVLGVFCLVVAVLLVTFQFLGGFILVGTLLLAFTAYRNFTFAVSAFYRNLTEIEDQARYSKRWLELFELKPKMVSNKNALKPLWEKPPVITFKNVSFSYPETKITVLKNVSFEIISGEKLAIVGLNGAGKTTLIKLLSRVYDPSKGKILVDGVDLKKIDLTHWREQFGVLFQDFSNFQMTAKEAIAIARPNNPVNMEKVIWSAKMAGADEFIEKFPKKYDQLLWKGFQDGVELSKGQFQRMAVARIFYRDALISVLDEPTSAIDAVTEEKIFEMLETKMDGRTVVLISHRFSTVKNADKIAVIEHGELKEIGSHKNLMESNGRYAELYNMQAKRYLTEEN